MWSRTVSLLLVVSVLLLLAADIEAEPNPFLRLFRRERTMATEYALLNKHLVRRLQTDLPRENLDEAARLLEEVEAGKKSDRGVELPSAQALVQFIELNNLIDPFESHCDMFAHDILTRNAEATGCPVLRPLDEHRPLMRVGMVVHHAAWEHAEHCVLEYPRKFARFRKELRTRPLSNVRQIMQALINTQELFIYGSNTMDARQLDAIKARHVVPSGKVEAKALLRYLRRCDQGCWMSGSLTIKSHPEKRGHWAVEVEEVRAIMGERIHSPCGHLLHRFAANFEPAILEQQLFPEAQRYRAASEEMANFMIWLEYYRLCKEIKRKRRQVEDAVIHAIWDELEAPSEVKHL